MKEETYIIEGMHCAACSSAVERVTRKLPGVVRSDVNLTTGKMTIEYEEGRVEAAQIIKKIEKAGFGAKPLVNMRKKSSKGASLKTIGQGQSEDQNYIIQNNPEDQKHVVQRNITIFVVAIAGLLLYVSMGTMMLNAPLPSIFQMHLYPINFGILQMLMALIIIFICRHIYISGFRSLLFLNPNMDSLVAIGSTAAFLYSLTLLFLMSKDPSLVSQLFFEASAVVPAIVSLGKYMEETGKQKTKDAIKALMDLSPQTAILLHQDGSQEEVPLDTLEVGNLVIVKPGSQIPLDGLVISGSSGVDESMLTGESMPVDKEINSKVIGGSINQNGVLTVSITSIGEDTTLAKIISFVENAQGKKAPISRTADKVAGVFVPIVIVIALVSAIVWLILGKEPGFALKIFTSILVIACPCAMGLATPTAILVGTGLGARNGILIRSGEALETTHKVNMVVLDKTGTITLGSPRVTSVELAGGDSTALTGGNSKELAGGELTKEELLDLTAAVELSSSHPLAKAFKDYATGEIQVLDFENITGKGLKANVEGLRASQEKHEVLIGNEKLMVDHSVDISSLSQKAMELAAKGETLMLIAVNRKISGLIGVSDPIKPTSSTAIESLKAMGIKVVMLTGDKKATARHIADTLGIDQVIAEVLPQEKAKAVEDLQKLGNMVMMVGDGINDAPALAQADIGCAIGSGSDAITSSAHLVLMKNDLRDVPKAIELSRLAIANIKQNLFWAFFYNTIGIPIAAGVLYPAFNLLLSPMIGALAMSLSSIFVVGNALRLRNKKIGGIL